MATSCRNIESAVVDAPVEQVWKLVRPLDFSFLKGVEVTACQAEDCDRVGACSTVKYPDGTSQTIQRLELSDLKEFVTYQIIASEPAVSYTSQMVTIRCRPITENNTTLVEWVSLFSNDAGLEVVQDSKYKKLDGLKALKVAVSK